jgi:type I restriction-modification system DNA methylase subunit
MTKEEAKDRIKTLIEKFSSQIDFYKSLNYNETQTRQDFINPFFKALGWDIDNRKQQLETYRDVRHEYRIKVNGHSKAPDYSFNVEGKRKFFVEAKKSAISINDNPEPALQVRNYGWNAKLNISIVTDFEEFAIYDCTKKPNNIENANAKRLKYIYYTDYLNEFDFIYDTFSYESVLNRSIENYAKSKINFKTAELVDKEFLKSLENWREYLATTIALRNSKLEEEEINFAVQQIIDRIVFLKVCEDRKIENENNLFKLTKSGNLYQNLFQYFQIADQKYNSGLFNFKKDTITKDLEIDNKVIRNIITELYGKSKENEKEYGYNFAIIPVEILGLAYEQFLGKVIRLTAAHHAKIEEKPEVRKAGGVYYTPEYIVEYIVKNTVGKLIEGKTPEEITKIKILDPSCGSGSFLLGAYQYLLDYHLKYYNDSNNFDKVQNFVKVKKDNPITPDGNLTSKEKKRILLNNIYGVDIDTQAVEVTKLSLLLKALEGETDSSIQTSLQLFNERVLPTIDSNIQCGNSLIASDFYNKQLNFTPKEMRQINVFDWKDSFKEIFQNNGFDIVIGNPPYVFTRDVDFGSSIKEYYKENYLSLMTKSSNTRENQTGKINLFALFVIRSLQLLNENGYLSYIIPNTILRTTIYEGVRKYLLDNTNICKIVDLKSGVFENVTASTIILQLTKTKETENVEIVDNPVKTQIITDKSVFINKNAFYKNPSYSFNIFVENDETTLFDKIRNQSINLSELVNVFNGVATFKNMEGIYNEKINDFCKKLLLGKDIGRYFHQWNNKYVEYIPKKLQRSRDEKIFLAAEKLIMQRIGGILITSYDNEQYYTFNSVNNLLPKQTNYSLKYILAILNSKFMIYYYTKNFTNKSSLTVNISKTYLDKLPIAKIDFTNKEQKQDYDFIIEQIENQLNLQKQLKEIKLDTHKTQINRLINHSEKQINEKIYKLYSLTPEEIITIENV